MTAELLKEAIVSFVYGQASCLLLVLSAEGVVLEANDFTYAFFGTLLVGRNFRKLIVPAADKLDVQELANRPLEAHLFKVKHEAGEAQPVYFNFVPVAERILAIGQYDPSETEKLGRLLSAVNEELDNLAVRLQESERKVRELTALKERFSQVASGDLRHALEAISASAEILARELGSTLSPEQRRICTSIGSQSSSAMRVLDEVLALGKT